MSYSSRHANSLAARLLHLLCSALFLGLICLALATLAAAQFDTVTISGTITDSSGAVIPHATVIVRNQWNARQFAADDDNVYWHTDDCKLMKLAK